MSICINKDIVSLIVKHTSPTLFLLYYDYRDIGGNLRTITKCFSADSIPQIVSHLYATKNGKHADWIDTIIRHNSCFDYDCNCIGASITKCTDCAYNDFKVFGDIISRYIKHIKIDEWL